MTKPVHALLIAVTAILLCTAHSYASDQYYLEIGSESDEAQAAKTWQGLSTKYKSMLHGMQYYPKTVYQDGTGIGTRIQAGPVASKAQAQKICNKLFAAKTSCFVIEDLDKAPPQSVTSLSDQAQQKQRSIQIVNRQPEIMPWLAEKNSQPQPVPVSESQKTDNDSDSMWSWLPSIDSDSSDKKTEAKQAQQPQQKSIDSDDDSESMWSWLESDKNKQKPARRQPQANVNMETVHSESTPPSIESKDIESQPVVLATSKDGNVDVAEAIRVPLSHDTKSQDVALPSPSAGAQLASDVQPKTKNGLPSTEILDASPVVTTAQISMMRQDSGVTEPTSNGAGWLNIASFHDEDQATQTWQQVRRTIPEKAAGLRVRIVRPFLNQQKDGTSLNVGPFASNSDAMDFCNSGVKAVNNQLNCRFSTQELAGNTVNAHSNAYAARQMSAAAEKNNQLSSAAGRPAGKSYWAEVITAKSQMEAVSSWDKLRKSQPEILSGKRSNIASSAGNYVVRVGPMTQNEEAQSLCRDLKSHNVSCSIAVSSR